MPSLLAFRLKVYTEIISAIKNTVEAQLAQYGIPLDWNPGSLIRTACEAAALQDAEQYAQIAKLLDLFSIDNTHGDDIDRRALDFGTLFQEDLARFKPRRSYVDVVLRDSSYTQVSTTLLLAVGAAATQLSVPPAEAAKFPLAGRAVIDRCTPREETIYYVRAGGSFTVIGTPYGTAALTATRYNHPAGSTLDLGSTASVLSAGVAVGAGSFAVTTGTGITFPTSGKVILGRETANREMVQYTRVGDTFTVVGVTTKLHALGDSVILSTVGSDRSASSGSEVQVPATQVSVMIPFTLQAVATLYDGDVQSAPVRAISKQVGANTRIGSGQLTTFASPPFASATVFNPYPAVQGADIEQDDAYISRLKSLVQGYSRTPLSIATRVLGLTDPQTGAVVGFSQFVDAVSDGLSHLFITDGSVNFSALNTVVSGREVLIGTAADGDRRARFSGAPPIQVVKSPGVAIPQTPSIGQAGAAGATTYSYVVVARVGAGGAPTAIASTGTGNAVLTPSNYNVIQFYPVDGASSYDIYRVVGGATQGIIGTVTQPASLNALIAFNDTGLFATAGSPPASNTTATQASAITPRLFRSNDRGFATSVGVGYLEDTTKNWGINTLVGRVFKTDDNQFFTVTSNTAIRLNFTGPLTPSLGAYSLFDFSQPPLLPELDYAIGASTGDVELNSPLLQYDALVAADDGNTQLGAYIYSTGLVAYVQKVVNGDDNDNQNFPGLNGHGSHTLVSVPNIYSPNFTIRVVPRNGTTDAQLVTAVQDAVARVVNSLGMGATIQLIFIYSEIADTVPNVKDALILAPSSNFATPAGYLPRITRNNVSIV